MVLYLAIAAALVSLSLIIRVIRFAVVLVLVALVIELVTGHGPATATELARLVQ